MKHAKWGLLVALFVAGCGPKEFDISGTVNFNGEPVKEGHIAFTPEAGGKGGGSAIENGRYSIKVPAGKMKVAITASKMVKLPDGQKGMYGATEELRPYIPERYNSQTELVRDVAGSTTMDFELTLK